MSFRKKSLSLIAVALGVSLLGLSQFAELRADAGRDFSRCVLSCNETRKACQDNCQTDCADLYPGDEAAKEACQNACADSCGAQSDECKALCQNIKDPSPDGGGEEP